MLFCLFSIGSFTNLFIKKDGYEKDPRSLRFFDSIY